MKPAPGQYTQTYSSDLVKTMSGPNQSKPSNLQVIENLEKGDKRRVFLKHMINPVSNGCSDARVPMLCQQIHFA